MPTNLAVSTNFGSLTTSVFPGSYNQNNLNLGPLMMQANDAGNEGKWVGPVPIAVARPVETSLAMPGVFPEAISWSSTYDWVFLADNATASATRRIELFTFNKTVRTGQWAFAGAIVCTIPSQGTQGTYTNRGISVAYEKYTTGTVSINNGSASLTGSGTTWSADRMFIGSRIGFGSTDPSQITTWYEISAIGGDTAITLTQNFAQSNISGSAYVIEDLRVLFNMTNGTTAANGGTFMVAGIRFENFTTSGFAISAATTVDKIRACYWLGDGNASSNATIQTCAGMAIDARSSWTSQMVYSHDAAAGFARFQVNNFRAAMTLTAGRDSTGSTWQFNTGQQAVTGTISQVNNLVLCTPGSGGGPRSGIKSLFWVTTSRVYSAAVANITTGSTTFQSGNSVEIPPGSTTTYAATSSLNTIEYDSLADRFFIMTVGTSGVRSYYTQYREDAGQWDRIILSDLKQINQSTVDATAAIFPATSSQPTSVGCVGGMAYIATAGTAANTNFLYNLPMSADWEYASTTNCRVVLPVMTLTGFAAFVAAYISQVEVIGGKTGTNLGVEPGAIRLYYRTSGISDNSGSWNLLDYSGNMSSVGVSATIQAMVEFRIATAVCMPARLTRVCFEGTGATTDSHFQFSQKNSSLASKQFSFRYSTAFGTTVPTLYMRIYDGVTGSLLVSDDSVTQAGTWEKSTNGGSSWGAYNSTDRANETTYLRFTPASIADNVNAQPVLGLS